MVVLSTIISAISILFHIYKYTNKIVGFFLPPTSGSNSYKFKEPSNEEELLESLQIDFLNECYASKRIENFNLGRALQKIERFKPNFIIKHRVRKGYVIYVQIAYGKPFNAESKDFMATFSINFIRSNDNVMVYGSKTDSLQEKSDYDLIATDLIHILSA